jgi:hypothetical protein
MKRSIIFIFFLILTIIPVKAIAPDVLAGFWQFERGIYYAKSLNDLYPYISTLEVQNLKALTTPQQREKRLAYFRQQYLIDPVFTGEQRVPEGIKLSGTASAIIDSKRYHGKFNYIMKQEGGRWVSWSRQFISDL